MLKKLCAAATKPGVSKRGLQWRVIRIINFVERPIKFIAIKPAA